MEMPQLTEAHRQLEKFVGSWTGDEKLFPSPWDPKGGAAVGRVVNRLAVDGFAMVQEYEQERGGKVTFRGLGILRYDAGEKCYVMYWFDSMGQPPNVFKGNFEGNRLTLSCRDAQGNMRAAWDFLDKDRYSFRMDFSGDGQNWQPFSEGTLARVKS
jgi:hypothetical protein